MINSNSKIFLIVIIFLAAIVRLPFLGQFPNGFSGDEAEQGYSAYSILKTGQDEWGQTLPLFPRGFGDFKPPIYTYLTVPSVAVFGLTKEAVRIPAALVGILSVLTLYFLAKELFGMERIAILSAFFMAILPWHIQVSRTAFEGGVGILFFSLGLLFYLKSNSKLLILSGLFFGLTLYTYHSFRVFTLLFIVALFLNQNTSQLAAGINGSQKNLPEGILRSLLRSSSFLLNKLNIKKNLSFIVIILIFCLPLVLNIQSSLTRASDVGITSSQNITSYFENKGVSPLPIFLDKIVDNKFLFLSNRFFENYLSYYQPAFLFTGSRSDGSYLNFPGFPLAYPVELVFFIFTGYLFITKKVEKVVILWILLATIPASLATDRASAQRAITLLPIVPLISAIGLNKIMSLNIKHKKLLLGAIGTVLVFSFIQFFNFYFIKSPQHPVESLRPQYEQIFSKILSVQDDYNEIVISKSFSQAQIFVAFYGKVDPITYQEASKNWLRYEDAGKLYIDQLESWNLGKYLFEDLNWKLKDSKRKNALVIGKSVDFPEDVVSILDVKNQKEQVIYRLIPVNNEI